MSIKLGAPILIAFVLMFAFFTQTASASPYNISSTTDNTFFQYSGFTALDACDPYDVKIACNKYDFCVLMAYLDNPSCTRGVHIWYSTNGFQNDCHAFNFLNCRGIGQVPTDYNSIVTTTDAGYFHLPYDVVWDENGVINETESFWLMVEDKTYRFDSNIDIDFFGNWFINDAAKADFVAVDNFWQWSPAQYGIDRAIVKAGGCWGLKFDDDNPSNVSAFCALSHQPSSGAGVKTSGGFSIFNFSSMVMDRDYLAQHKIVTDTGPNCLCTITTSTCVTTNRVDFWDGTVEPDGLGDWVWHVEVSEVYGKYDFGACHIPHTLTANNSNSITWMAADGLHHELAGSFYFMNLTDGMWSAAISGAYAGFGTPLNIYGTDDSIYEVINSSSSSDFAVSGKAVDYIGYIRTSNSTLDGIYTYRQELRPIQILLETTVSASASLLCISPYYVDGDAGFDFLQLGSTCIDPQIDISSTTNIPTSFSYNATLGSDCSPFIIRAGHLNSPYDYKFKVIDFENGLPIENATVTLVGISNGTTDANGEVEIEIQPINNANFTVEGVDSCTDRLVASGDPKSYVLRITEPDYQLYEDVVFQPASDTENPDDGGTFALTKEGVFLEVNIKSTSGAVLSPCSYFMLVNGSDEVFEIVNGVESYKTNITEFPARLRLQDDNATLNITLSLFKIDGTWDNITDTVIQNEEYEYDFWLPAPQNIPCADTCDCPDSACIGRYFYDLASCDGNCTYSVTDCGSANFCDDRVGCFQTNTSMVCDLLWIEADTIQCPNYCLTNNTMVLGQCGADSFCKNKTISCVEYCDDETGACNEMRFCLSPEPAVFKVQLSGVIQSQTCSLNNIGQKYCMSPISVPFNGSSWDLPSSHVLTTLPDGWSYSTNTTNETWDYWSPLVECTSSCEPYITYCQYGCDPDTLQCFGKGSGQLFDLPYGLNFLFSATFLWTMLALIIGAILTFLPSKVSVNAQPTPEIGLSGMFVLYIVGLAFGFVDPLIGLLVVIGLGLGLAKIISGMLGG